MSPEYYELNQLFGGYMHQDSGDEFTDAYVATEEWLRETDESVWKRALLEIASLLAATSGPLERRRTFERSIEFLADDGHDFDAWLLALRSRLEHAVARGPLVSGTNPAANDGS